MFAMIHDSCLRCGSGLAGDENFCPTCGVEIASDYDARQAEHVEGWDGEPSKTIRDPVIGHRLGPGQWGFWPPALGLMALVPSAILVSLLALVLPLATTTVVAAVILALIQLCLVWILTTRSWPLRLHMYGLRHPLIPRWRALILSLFALGGSLGAIQLYVLAADWLGLEFLVPPDLPSELLLPGNLAALSVIALAAITPVAEEVFFRGFLLRGFINRLGVAPGIVVGALAFAGLHFQPAVIVPVFITGLLLGWLYWQTGSIWPGIGVHAGQNLIATLGIIVGF